MRCLTAAGSGLFFVSWRAATSLAIEVRSLEVRAAEDIDSAFEVARNERPDALLTVEDPLTFSYQQRIAGFAVANQLPSLHGVKEFALAGGLMSYGTNVADVYRRAASYVDKILKGASPADLPVRQPTRFELVINLQTAKKLRLAVSPLLLARADEVIE
jgi:putative ABC transport system substrate-binding protein